MIAACAVVAITGAVALRNEQRVAQAQIQLIAELQRPTGTTARSAIRPAWPARARLVEALRLAGAAAREPDDRRRAAMLDTAAVTLQGVAAVRPRWGDAAVAQAYVAVQRHGAASAPAIAALATSYAATPFVRDAAGWRIATGLAAWDRLDAPVRQRVIEEAAWWAQTSYRAMLDVTAMVRGTPAYQPFMLRWRALRMSGVT